MEKYEAEIGLQLKETERLLETIIAEKEASESDLFEKINAV
jgi:hypothetical protein